MEDGLKSSVAQALKKLSLHIGILPPTAFAANSCDVERIRVKAQWLIRMLGWVRATLDDAEDMDPTDDSVRRWLRELDGVADAAEDVLDEFSQQAMHLGLVTDGTEDAIDGGEQLMVDLQPQQQREIKRETLLDVVRRSSSPTPPHKILAFLCCAEKRIENMVSRFVKIEKPGQGLRREFKNRQIYAQTMSARRATMSATQEPYVFGRDEDLAKVKQFLLSSDTEPFSESDDMDVPVMAIVGMGGLGKTTLARLAYHDDEVNQHFQLKSWVCASENFDVIRMTKAMVEPFDQESRQLSELDPLHRKLKMILEGKSFLLVFDDVWEVDKFSSHWNLLTAPLRNSSACSKIIITTRNSKVSEIGGRMLTYDLPCLEDEDCCKLFERHAFEGQDPDSYPNLAAIGKEIARNCRGLPLVAKTIGGQLHATDGEEVWKGILKSHVWSSTVQGESIMPILRLSYQHLPAHLKRCFRYCSVFPKNYRFHRDRLIRMWMAHGYMKAKGREIVEDVGKRYFDDLLSRSFFQYSQTPEIFTMHDLMHDLARCVSANQCPVETYPNRRHVRHHGCVISKRTLFLGGSGFNYFFMPFKPRISSFALDGLLTRNIETRDDLFARMQPIRVLVVDELTLSEFPLSIIHLKHLRYLSVNMNVKNIPESMWNLYHLQTLELMPSVVGPFRDLPHWISSFVNLRHLICRMDGLSSCVRFPVGIGKLTNLRTLPGFLVSPEHGCAKLGELIDMNNIEGTLAITNINQLTDVNEAKKACVWKKRKLRSLKLRWHHYADPAPIHSDVLESLKPSPKLENLSISGFEGTSLPSWLGHPSFSKLAKIELEGCRNWASLPPLGQLPSLKFLSIQSANSVKSIGGEFFSGGFPHLRTLHLKNMEKWKSWHGAEKGEFPHLRELIIADCVNLVSLSTVNLDALEILRINGCDHAQFPSEEQLPPALQVFSMKRSRSLSTWCQCHRQRLMHVQQVEIQGLHDHLLVLQNVRCVEEAKSLTLKHLSEVLFLELAWNSDPNVISFAHCDLAEEVLENLKPCRRLNQLVIRGYNGMAFASWLGKLRRLRKLHIKGAHALRRFGIEFCNGSGRIDGMPAFPLLETLELDDMPNWEEWMNLEMGDLPKLQKLIIHHCPMLKNLPPLPQSLNHLEIEDCNPITFPSSLNHLSSLRTLRISQVPTLHQLPVLPIGLTKLTVGDLPALANLVMPPSVRDLEVRGCNEALLATSLLCRTHLTSLHIIDFQNLTTFPLHNLVMLKDVHGSTCSRLVSIDPHCFSPALLESTEGLQALSSLEHFPVSDCALLRQSGKEFSNRSGRIDGMPAFPYLLRLEFDGMPNWEEWLEMGKTDLPCLRELVIRHCPKLKKLPPLRPTLNVLEMEGCCPIISQCSLDDLTSLCTLRISQVPTLRQLPVLPLGLRNLTLRFLPELDNLLMPPTVRDLELQSCNEVPVAASLPHLTHLTSLQIIDFPNLTRLPLHNLVMLRNLRVSTCPRLETIDCFYFSPASLEYVEGLQALKSLEHLSVSDCTLLHFSANERPSSTLLSMEVVGCPSVASWRDKIGRKRKRSTDEEGTL